MLPAVAVTGLGLEVPGIDSLAALLPPAPLTWDPAAFKPENVLGRKGLLGKDRATRLALCAVKKALQDAGLIDQPLGETCGVIVSSSLGNLDTVCKVSQAIHEGHIRDLSVLDLPNASSNVIASSIAIRFACRALNLTLCGGSDGGTQAVHLARNAILANRATRMIVVGVEPRTDASESLLTQSLVRWVGEAPPRQVEGAAALVLETVGSAVQRQARVYGLLGSGGFLHSGSLEASVASAVDDRGEAPQLWLPPSCASPSLSNAVRRICRGWEKSSPAMLDLGERLGEGYSLMGVLQVLVGSLWLQDRGPGWVLATSGGCCGERFTSVTLARDGLV